ncbi:MAG TPA: hypothetical protein VF763_08295 [Candidatus Limnocylindrales bacterium]
MERPDGRRAGAGQGVVEYGLMLGLAALVTLVALTVFGPQLAAAVGFLAAAASGR